MTNKRNKNSRKGTTVIINATKTKKSNGNNRRTNRSNRQNTRQPASTGGAWKKLGNAALKGLSAMPGPIGLVGSGLSRAFGSGDYNISSNTFLSRGVPTFSSLDKPFRFQHREFLGTIQSSTDFDVMEEYVLNPGLLAPLLSQIAHSFTMYKFHGLIFVFNSTSASSIGSTNTGLGVNGMVAHYDPDFPGFNSRQAAEEYVGCQSGPPSQMLYLPVECKPNSTMVDKRFVRFGPTVKPLDSCDLGKVFRFSDGAQAVSTIGELWVTYDVEFFLPNLDNSAKVGTDVFGSGAHSGVQGFWVGLEKQTQNLNMSIDGLGKMEFITPGIYRIMTNVFFDGLRTPPTTFGYTLSDIGIKMYQGPYNLNDWKSPMDFTPNTMTSRTFTIVTDVVVTESGATISLDTGMGSVSFTQVTVSYIAANDRQITPVLSAKQQEVETLRTEIYKMKRVLEKAVTNLSLAEQKDILREEPSYDQLE